MNVLFPTRFFRVTALFVAISCVGLLAYAYWLQFARHLEPCPLCIFQRIAFMSLAITAVMAVIHNPSAGWRRGYALVGAFCALAGIGVAGRHLWLQGLPPDLVPECGPGLNYLLENFPLTDAIKKAFTGSGECASIDWSFLGLSMPSWVLGWFLFLGILFLLAGFHRT